MAHDVSKHRVAPIATTHRYISEDFGVIERRTSNLTIYFKIVYPYTDENRLVKNVKTIPE